MEVAEIHYKFIVTIKAETNENMKIRSIINLVLP